MPKEKTKNPVMVEAGRKAYKKRLENLAKLGHVITPKKTKGKVSPKTIKSPVKRTQKPIKSVLKPTPTHSLGNLTLTEFKNQMRTAGYKVEIIVKPTQETTLKKK